ncbi:MAG: helicase C-terminal domain-containing protein [Pyrinomonadaceae bacterium]
MSTVLEQDVSQLEPEVVSAEMIDEAVESCFATAGGGTERALEFAAPEHAVASGDGDEDQVEPQEVETAEEVSLKNGVYHEIKRKLNERYGIPFAEIAFIHEADTPAKKAALFKAVNAGRVRVLIGSTSKLGTGVNVQKRLVALHHVDEPWKPAELEQREGRILRQGNIYPEVYLFHYVTERSFDGYMLQTLESKARFISQILAGEVTARTAEDVGDMVLTVAQVKAIASGNPMVQRRIELEVKLVKLDRLRAAYYNNRAAMRADLEELPQIIAAQEAEVEGHGRAVRARQPLEEDKFAVTLKRKLGDAEAASFDKRERAGAHIRYLADLLLNELRRGAGRGSLTEEVGSYRGFKVYVYVSGNSRFVGTSSLFDFQTEIHLRAADGGTCYIAQVGESNVGITQSIDYQLRHLEDRLEQTRAGLEMLRTRLATVRTEVDKPWAYAAEYRRLRRDYEAMGAALQAEGIEVERSTTFTAAEEEAETADAEDENRAGATGAGAAETTSTDELAARLNPFTGLEDWPIIVEEQSGEVEDAAEFSVEKTEAGGGTLSFAFAAADEVAKEEETDIFLSPPSDTTEPVADENERAKNSLNFRRAPGATTAAKALPTENGMKNGRHAPGRKPARQLPSNQKGFLWG